MRILELDIKHFGKFENHRMRFTSGVNIIYGGNETGKSTIHAFIRAMLYGLEPARHRAGRPGEYELRQPWENGAWFAGSMRVSHGGRVYRIERNFYRHEKSLQIVCETDGQPAEDPQRLLQEMLSGMDEAAFRNTVCISQSGAETDQGLAQQLQHFFVNMRESGDGSVDVQAALGRLNARRKKLEKEKEQAQKSLDETIAARTTEQHYLQQELDRLEGSLRGEAPGPQIEPDQPEGSLQGEEAVSSAADPETGVKKKAGDGIELTWYPQNSGRMEDEAPSEGERDDHPDDTGDDRRERRSAGRQRSGERQSNTLEPVNTDRPRSAAGEYRRSVRRFAAFLRAGSALIIVLAIACAIVAPSLLMKITMLSIALFFVLLLLLLQSAARQGMARDMLRGVSAGDAAAPEEGQAGRDARRGESGNEGSNGGAGRSGKDSRDSGPGGADSADAGSTASGTQPGAAQRSLQEYRSRTRTQIDNLDAELKELYRKSEELEKYDRECEAIDLAAARIRSLSEMVFQESGRQFADSVSEVLTQLTEGHYTSISLDEQMHVRVNTPEKLLDLTQISYASMHQIYFALRMAAAQLLGGRQLPVILDEPFAMYDDERLEAALRWLENEKRQVIIFTCRTREKAMLDYILHQQKA